MAGSNLAYNSERYESYNNAVRTERSSNLRIRTVKNSPVTKNPETVQKRKVKAKTRKKHNLSLVLLAAVAFLVLCRGVSISEKVSNNEKKRAELEQLITTNQKLQLEIDSALNLKNVEIFATTELNMARPEKNQTFYIKINQPDYVEKIDGGEVENSSGNFFGTLKAYLD